MKKTLLLMSGLLLLSMEFAGCKDNDESIEKIYVGGIEVPYKPTPFEVMPDWMREMISIKGFAVAQICQGEYNGNIVYNILSGYSSNLIGDNYNEKGDRFYGVDINQVKNWVCIYNLYFMY